MHRLTMIAAALVTLSTALAAPPVRAQAVPQVYKDVGNQLVNPESHVWTRNESDAWVWITVYNHFQISGSWCVNPHSVDKHGLHTTLVKVRAEVTHRGCSHPVILDKTIQFPGFGAGKPGTVVLKGANGTYAFDAE